MTPVSALLVALAAACALAAAARSTWSPCGLSMLSTITPMGERARRYTYGGTAAWFVVGAVAGGITLGAACAALAAGVSALDVDPRAALAVAAGLAVVGAASDAHVGGFRLPGSTRQVDEVWLDRYRSWVYGAGFGWQIGVGLTTYLVTAAVYLTIALAALTGDPLAALLVGAGFGLVRGLAVLLSRSATTLERLQALHRRFDGWSAPSRTATIAAQVALAAVAATAAYGAPAALVVIAAAVVPGLALLSQRRGAPVPTAPRTTPG
jgi:MFS family permease